MTFIPSGKKNIHFIGVGGIGMSAIARILLETGRRVSGSDLEPNHLTKALDSLGGRIFEGHRESNIPKGTALVVYSSSIGMSNPEIVEAKRRGIPILHRAEALGELLNSKKGIAVTGTHGKTTTTSLLAVILARAGYSPTVAIGGEVEYFHSNAKAGKGSWMVAEADESDGSFRHLKPFYTVVTNVEMEHIDYYRTLDDAIDGYARFVNNTKAGGALFYNNNDKNTRKILARYRGRSIPYGLRKNPFIYPTDIKMERFESSYKCVYRGKVLGTVRLKIPGIHNIANSLAAIAVALEMGIGFDRIALAMADFKGAGRRFQLRFDSGGIMLIDDYAHHPTEIGAVIKAARKFRRKRLIAVFQPHRFTRTKFLKAEFGAAFGGVDKLILTDIYAASERPIKGVTIEGMADEVRKRGPSDVVVINDKDDIPAHLVRESRRGDMILIMGAGSIKKTADVMAEVLRIKSEFGRLGVDARFGEPLAPHTTFKIGGPADVLVRPRNVRELKDILVICKKRRWKVFVVGNGSNLLVSDEGYRGVVISLTSGSFKTLKISGTRIRVGAGCHLGALIRKACAWGLEGLESLVGIPGTVGGAIFMNAGGAANPMFGTIGTFVSSLKVIDYDGRVRTLSRPEILFGYRDSNLSPYIILEATLRLSRRQRDILASRAADFLKLKASKQVLDAPSAGCIFKNPADGRFTAGQLIDMMGFKGVRAGGAEVSPKHANFIVNTGGATARDVLALVDSIKKKALETYGIALELEVKVL